MKLVFSWKKGLLYALIFVIVGFGLFIFAGSKIDFNCKNTIAKTVGCNVYNGINVVIQGYSDFWRLIFAPRCVGGNGPDDCLGPDAGIMFFTLAISGFFIGGTSRQKLKN